MQQNEPDKRFRHTLIEIMPSGQIKTTDLSYDLVEAMDTAREIWEWGKATKVQIKRERINHDAEWKLDWQVAILDG